MVDWGRLLSGCSCERTAGSNPVLPAKQKAHLYDGLFFSPLLWHHGDTFKDISHKEKQDMLLEGKRIVYIEDNEEGRDIVDILLQAAGAEIWFEKWGIPGTVLMTLIGHLPLDLILLDLNFEKGYSGYDIFEIIKRNNVLKDIPVLLVTAANSTVEMPRARKLGLSGYISKPIHTRRFSQQVLDVIEGKSVWDD